MNGSQFASEDIPKTIIAGFVKGSYKRYMVKETSEREVLVFIYQKLEELILDAAFAEGNGTVNEGALIRAAQHAHVEQWPDAWLPIADAVTYYSFTPKGFIEGPVYTDEGLLLGRVLLSENEGVIVPFLAKTTQEFVDLVQTIVMGESIDALISIHMPKNPPKKNLVSIKTGLGRSLIAFVIGSKVVESMALGKKVTASDVFTSPPGGAELVWANEKLIALGVLDSWDEGGPLVIDIMLEGHQKEFVQLWAARMDDLYSRKASPQKILAEWVNFSEEVVADSDLNEIAVAVGKVLENDDLDPLSHSGHSIEEWAFSQAKKEDGRNLADAISEADRHTIIDQVERAVNSRYPELKKMHLCAVAWAWKAYVHKVENPSADIIHDDKYRIDLRERSVMFLCFILFSAAVTDRLSVSISESKRRVFVPSSSDGFEIDIEQFYLGLGQLAVFAVQSDKHHAEEVIFDFCEGLRRLVSSMKAMWSLCQAISDPRQGYTVLTDHDAEYCHARRIPLSLPVPKEANLQEENDI